MARFFGLTDYDRDGPGVVVGPELTAELRRLANLFLLSAITLILFLLRAFAVALNVTFIPAPAYVVWGVVMLTGWAMTLVYAVYVTFQARRWGWLALCAIPVTCVPAAVAYAWVRRQEIEREVLGDGPEDPGPRARQKKGGRKARR